MNKKGRIFSFRPHHLHPFHPITRLLLLSIRIRISLQKIFFISLSVWTASPGSSLSSTSKTQDVTLRSRPLSFFSHLSLRCLYLQPPSYFLLARPACVCASLCVAWSCSFSDAAPFRRHLSCDNSEDDAQRRRRRSCVLMYGPSPSQRTGRWDGEELLFYILQILLWLKEGQNSSPKACSALTTFAFYSLCLCWRCPIGAVFGNITRKFSYIF